MRYDVSRSAAAPEWDDFLESNCRGHFQQSSLWSRFKQEEGWQAIRLIAHSATGIHGGFQMLIKRIPVPGSYVGYISKGPVIPSQDRALAESLMHKIQQLAIEYRIRALIIHPPDNCTVIPPLLMQAPYCRNRLVHVMDANLIIDLRNGLQPVEESMRRTTLQEIRQARRRGIRIREGRGEEDAATFFTLMQESCRRQGNVKPNPCSANMLARMWNILDQNQHIRLTFAEFEGEPLAGLLSIAFGTRMTLWKKGWSSRHSDKRPNQLLYYDAMEWACANGYHTCDFAAMRRNTAEAILEHRPLPEGALRSRDFFNMGFGGTPLLLPASRLYIPSPILRMAYSTFARGAGKRRF